MHTLDRSTGESRAPPAARAIASSARRRSSARGRGTRAEPWSGSLSSKSNGVQRLVMSPLVTKVAIVVVQLIAAVACRSLTSREAPMPRWIAYAALVLVAGATKPFVADTVVPNDNRRPIGTLEKGVLTVSLEARTGRWYPEGEGGRALEVAAFAEPGKPLSNPGPLIRVTVGTTVRATIHNRLDKPLKVFGFGKTRGMSDSVVVPVDARIAVSFTP